MRIAIDARIIHSSTGRYIERLLHYLQKIDTENEYLVLMQSKDYDYWKPRSKNFKRITANYRQYSFGEQLGFAKLLYSLNVDLVHFTMPQQPLLYRKLKVTTIHDLILVHFENLDKPRLIYKIEQAIFKYLLKKVSKTSQTIIAPTEHAKKDVLRFSKINEDKIVVTPEAADIIKDTPKTHPKLNSKQFLLYVGNAFPHKNLLSMIDAFARLKAQHPDLHLALAGKKEFFYGEVEKYAWEQGVQDIHFLDWVDDATLKWLYQNAQCYVFTSLAEGFGLPPLEAMQYGLPVASSNASCMPEVCGNAAEYFNPNDIEDIAGTINRLLLNADLRKQRIDEGYRQVKKYSWRTMAEQTLDIYNKAARR